MHEDLAKFRLSKTIDEILALYEQSKIFVEGFSNEIHVWHDLTKKETI